eukprot:m.982876 g.982876  ORF g.982876 m.982876 type:complete len:163 (-) comp23973_c0_seq31:211-699(-)
MHSTKGASGVQAKCVPGRWDSSSTSSVLGAGPCCRLCDAPCGCAAELRYCRTVSPHGATSSAPAKLEAVAVMVSPVVASAKYTLEKGMLETGSIKPLEKYHRDIKLRGLHLYTTSRRSGQVFAEYSPPTMKCVAQCELRNFLPIQLSNCCSTSTAEMNKQER